jgi:hypothetical protein
MSLRFAALLHQQVMATACCCAWFELAPVAQPAAGKEHPCIYYTALISKLNYGSALLLAGSACFSLLGCWLGSGTARILE